LKTYLTVGSQAAHEITINKSRFIGLAFSIEDESDIALCLDRARVEYPAATHYCYGAVIGQDGLIQRFSDDGEPGGTAGMPILQVLVQKELRNVLVVVVRYFGGIKLGAGSLVRAYTQSAVEVIDKAGIVRMVPGSRGLLTLGYTQLGSVEYLLRQWGIGIEDIAYSDKVSIRVTTDMPWDELCGRIRDACSGNVQIIRLDDIYLAKHPGP